MSITKLPSSRIPSPPSLHSGETIRADSPTLEQDIEQAILARTVQLPEQQHIPDNEPDIGRLSAEAVLKQFEQTAKAVEQMGELVKDRISKLESRLLEADNDLKILGEAAKVIGEKGKLVSVEIEEAAAVSKDIRDMCAVFAKKAG